VYFSIDTLSVESMLSIDDFMGYLSSWSTYQYYVKHNNSDTDLLHDIRQR